MKTASVKSDLYTGAGWAVAAVVNDEVIAFTIIDHPDTGAVKEARLAVESTPAVQAALAKDDEEFEKAQAVGDDGEAEAVWSQKYCVNFRGGMFSGGEFTYLFSHAERKQAGIKNRWF